MENRFSIVWGKVCGNTLLYFMEFIKNTRRGGCQKFLIKSYLGKEVVVKHITFYIPYAL